MEGQNSYMMSGDELFFFNEKPAALHLYGAFAQRLFKEHIGEYEGEWADVMLK